MVKRGLGKGLEALIPPVVMSKQKEDLVTQIPLNHIQPNPNQPRRVIDEEKLQELAKSIESHGVIQPIVVRALGGDRYELIAGERRWRACCLLQVEKIPALIKEIDPQQISEVALIENIQREDLHSLEEARAYKALMEDYRITQEDLARRLGKSRSVIANTVRLLLLHPQIQLLINEKKISAGHGRALLALDNESEQLTLARVIVEKELSVRETEKWVQRIGEGQDKKEAGKKARIKAINENTTRDIESRLRSLLGTKVKIKDRGGKGKIEVEYYDVGDLERILDVFLKGEIL
ncbi:MAG: ParB/RepB/Spo0J family partition protein [Bacillota bacterium]